MIVVYIYVRLENVLYAGRIGQFQQTIKRALGDINTHIQTHKDTQVKTVSSSHWGKANSSCVKVILVNAFSRQR